VHVVRNILKVKQKHSWFNPHLIAMSATLPSPTEELLDFFREKFHGKKFLKERGNKIEGGKRIYRGEITKDELVTVLRHCIDSGKRSLIVTNEVWFAVELYDFLCRNLKNLASAKDILLYHGRQLVSERRKIVEDIVEGRWLILVSTSACEVGLDVNTDILVTTLCPPDSFIQRVGRCARKSGQVGTVYHLVLKSLQEDKEIVCREFGVDAEDLKYIDSLQEDSPINLEVISSFIERTARKLANLYRKIQAISFPLAYNIDIVEKLTKYIYDFVEENSYVHLQIIQCLRNFEPEVRLLPIIGNEDEVIGLLKEGDYIRLPLYKLFVDKDASIKAESLIKGADINSIASVTYTLDGDYKIHKIRGSGRIVYNESPLTILISNKEKRELSTKGYVGLSGPRAKKDEKIDILLDQDEMGPLQVRVKVGKNVIDHFLPASYPLLAYFLSEV
ncbi:MAG: helicase-related protein, partial [Candidatus Bathyarchaeales archaeon]